MLNPVATTIINPWKEHWLSQGSNHKATDSYGAQPKILSLGNKQNNMITFSPLYLLVSTEFLNQSICLVTDLTWIEALVLSLLSVKQRTPTLTKQY